MRHRDINAQQLGNGAHQALGLAQWLLEGHAQRQAKLNRQIRIETLTAGRRESFGYSPASFAVVLTTTQARPR
jgi:hypothetical protein